MAVFQHNNRSIAYQMELAPFAGDLILLQGSRYSPDYWRPVIEDLGSESPAGGRILTLEWAEDRFTAAKAEDVARLIQTLGLQNVHVVACDDAVDLAAEIETTHPGLFEKTMFFPDNAPKGEELKGAVRAFCPF